MRFVKVIFSTVIVLLGIVFIIENLEVLQHTVRLKLDLYLATFQSPDVYLWVLVLFSFFLGVLTTALYGVYDNYQQRQTIRQLRHNHGDSGQGTETGQRHGSGQLRPGGPRTPDCPPVRVIRGHPQFPGRAVDLFGLCRPPLELP